MKRHIKGFAAGFLSALILIAAITAIAAPATVWKKIDVAFGGYNVYVDGDRFEARGTDGEILEPFNYNGWIYAPFEHIADAIGMEADWDGDTHSLFLISRDGPAVPRPTITPTPAPAPTVPPTTRPTPMSTPIPTPTPVPTPSPTPGNKISFIANTNSKVFHLPSCGTAARILTANRKDFYDTTRDEMVRLGYSPCGNCRP